MPLCTDDADLPDSTEPSTENLAAIGLRVAGLFHDLRTMCNVVSGCGELMARSGDRRERMDYLDTMWSQIDAVALMADEVLAFARGERTVFPRKVYLNRFMDQISIALIESLVGTDIELRFRAGYLGVAYFDEPKIVRVLDNLVRNASEALDGHGAIELATRADTSSVYFDLTDDGPGVPDDLVDTLFEPFATSKDAGTGLGLSICRSIVGEHNGDISVHSTSGGGTSFTVRLPLDVTDPAALARSTRRIG